jgi:hypothetical protein
MIVGGVGSVQSNVGGSVLARVHGSSAHQSIVDTRLVMSVFVWLLAVIGALAWRSRNANRTALVVCFIASFGMLAGGDYGGEGMLRVYLFSLPSSVCLIAALISKLRWPYRQAALGFALLLLVPFFVLSRWGNELFELVRPNEITAVKELYRIANPGSSLVSITPQLAWEFTDVDRFKYEPSNLNEFALESTPAVVKLVSGNPKGGYVIITTGQIVYGIQTYGLAPTWGVKIENLLSRSSYFKLRYANPNAKIFQYIPKGDSHEG